MLKFLLILFAAVYPLHKNEKAPCDVVAFDTLSAQKLLYSLDSLSFLSKKIVFYEVERNYYDSLIFSYKKSNILKDSLILSYKKQLKKLNKIRNRERGLRNIERIIFVILLMLSLLRR